ncbi:MAG: choice-of-anchor D domain-containing protein [Bacteroidota bacterium]|nr:choice-of-anchor D domain-containing protein [Bacteroidota bacterium]
MAQGSPRAQAQNRHNLDNLGTEFYLAFGPNLGANDQSNVMDLYITGHTHAHGKVEVPALGVSQTFTITPGQIQTIELPNGNNGNPSVEVTTDEQIVRGMAVHVTSDSEVAVFGLNHKFYSSDAFMGLPNDVLGTEYRTMCYQAGTFGGMNGVQYTPSEFWIVSIQDSTNVKITLADRSAGGVQRNTPQSVLLMKGDIYLVQGVAQRGNDLTGSLIESDRPIAVFSGHQRTNIPDTALNSDGDPSRDHLVEELPPVSAWGDSALVVPFATADLPDLVRVLCAEDSTEISVNGTSVGSYNAGQFYEITHLAGVTDIRASKPILVGQYMHTSLGGLNQNGPQAYGDPALALVFPVEQFTTSYTIVSIVDQFSFSGNFVNIVVPTDSISSMQLDGQPMDPAEFHPIANSRYAYAQHSLEQGTHNITGGAPFGVTVYALGPVDSYAYTGGTLLKTITPLKTVGLSIDFGDRVLGAAPGYAGTFDTTVTLINVSEDTVNIYSFPKRIQDTDRFDVKLGAPVLPLMISPLTTDSFTIQFTPHEVNRRMHTQITAKTDHLRAYVVDVYGRGVVGELGIFRDSTKIYNIDTLDFGTFTKDDVPKDSVVYIGNAGLAKLTINSVAIVGATNNDFSMTGFAVHDSTVDTPFTIAQAPSTPAVVGVRFTPNGAMSNGLRSAQLTVTSGSTVHTVVLLARMETIYPMTQSTASIPYGSALVCDDIPNTLTVTNPNDVAVTLLGTSIAGPNGGDFTVTTPTPILIAPHGSTDLSVHFKPASGTTINRQATLTLQFDLPKKDTVPHVINLTGTATKRQLGFAASQHIHVNGTDPFSMPIYATADLTPYNASGYMIRLSYDSVNLKLVDVATAGTLTPQGTSFPFAVFSKPPGHDTVIFEQSESNSIPIAGGGPSSRPLIWLKFQPAHANDGKSSDSSFTIAYDITLNGMNITSRCFDLVVVPGQVEIISSCASPSLTPADQLPPTTVLAQPTPDPFQQSTTMEYGVAADGPVKIEVLDATGRVRRTLVDGFVKAGRYTATLSGEDLPSAAYFIRITAPDVKGEYRRVRRVVLAR